MNETYENTVRQLLRVAPIVFRSGKFALKGGTAINLFIREMPRLSVDLDLEREQALAEISVAVNQICEDLKRQGMKAMARSAGGEVDAKIFIQNEDITVKIEINHVMRGVLSSVNRASITEAVRNKFKTNVTVPMLSPNEVYAGKLVAAMDRQHPRDLFDVYQLISNEGISDETIRLFVGYLSCHNRPIHEVLFGSKKDIMDEFMNNFVGMTTDDVAMDTLIKTREMMFAIVHSMLNAEQLEFLVTLSRAEPKWDLVDIPKLKDMPGMKWKLQNLEKLKSKNIDKFNEQAEELKQKLTSIRRSTETSQDT